MAGIILAAKHGHFRAKKLGVKRWHCNCGAIHGSGDGPIADFRTPLCELNKARSVAKKLGVNSNKARKQRRLVAEQTVDILKAGAYSYRDRVVDIDTALAAAVAGTVLHLPKTLLYLPKRPFAAATATDIYVSHEGTIACLERLAAAGHTCAVAALNFASAKNPGGGFLRGSLAQEECLAVATGLYACQTSAQAKPFYSFHRGAGRGKAKAGEANLYSSRVLFSPDVPVFRRGDGSHALLPRPLKASFITAAAVNMSVALRGKDRGIAGQLARDEMRARARRVVEVAAHHGVETLVLGAWGCGVFRNDPTEVATALRDALEQPALRGRFRTVVFAIPGGGKPNATAFEAVFGAARPVH